MQPKLQLTAFCVSLTDILFKESLNRFLSMLETLPPESSPLRKRGERDPEK